MVYLDYNAASPLCPSAKEAMIRHLDSMGNPSAVHHYGRAARHLMETSRESLAQIWDVSMDEIIFTSGGTESNNLFLQTVRSSGMPLVMGDIEHASLTAETTIDYAIPFLPSGLIDKDRFQILLNQMPSKPFFVSIHWAHNVTGIIQPIADVVHKVHAAGGFLHVDACQAFGRFDLGSLTRLGLDYVTLSSHKVGGPGGVGAFIARAGRPLWPLVRGGGQEKFRRSGTPNTVGIVGFSAAAKSAVLDLGGGTLDRIRSLRDDLEGRLKTASSNSVIFGRDVPRLVNTCYITMPGVKSQTQVMTLDLKGFSVSAGSACSSGTLKSPSFLTSFGYSPEVSSTALRISLGKSTTQSDIHDFCNDWIDLYRRLGHVSLSNFQPI